MDASARSTLDYEDAISGKNKGRAKKIRRKAPKKFAGSVKHKNASQTPNPRDSDAALRNTAELVVGAAEVATEGAAPATPSCELDSAAIVALTTITEALPQPASTVSFYREAVAEGEEIIAGVEHQRDRLMRLGELADGVEAVYGKKKLNRFAEEIDIAACTLKRIRSVYRAWKGAPAPPSYSVAQELEKHPDKEGVLRDNPNLTKRAARMLMRAQDTAEREERAPNAPWTLEEAKRWVAGWVERGSLAIEDGPALDRMTPEILRQVIEPTTFDTMIKGALTWIKIVKQARRKLGPTPDNAGA
jgi:hypothetical protein